MTTKKISTLQLNRVLNVLLWVCFSAMSGIGFLLAFRLPSGSRGGRGYSALGLTRHEWGDIHAWLGYSFVLMVLIHLAMHWRWLWKAASKKRPLWMLSGLGVGIILILAIALQPVSQSESNKNESKVSHQEH